METSYLLGAIHGFLLLGLSWHSATRLFAGALRRTCAVFLMAWCNLAYTALSLASVSKLDHRLWYVALSLATAAAIDAILLFRGVRPIGAKSSPQDPPPTRLDRVVTPALAVTLLLAALGSAVICYFYVPNNWDSCTYRFSRAFFYLGRGDLLHSGNALDPRLLFYPFNGTLFYLFFAIHRFPVGWIMAVSCFAWLFAGLGSFFVARRLGASRTGSFAAAWICWMTPSVLAQASSANDEVLAAVPLLLALGFALEWFADGRARYAVLAGIGLGLGFGTKLHWIFYSVFAAGAAVLILVRVFQSAGTRAGLIRRVPAMISAAALAAPLAGAFLVANYLSSGKLTDAVFNNAVLNHPFRLSLAREKIRINTAQMFVSPIPDLVPPVNRDERKKGYAAFNQFFMKCCFRGLAEAARQSPELNSFQGPAHPDGAEPNEYSVWLGFMPHLLLLACAVGLAKRTLPAAAMVVAGAFFCWCATYSAEKRYIPTAAVYFSFPAVLTFGVFGPAWDHASRSSRWTGRLLLAGFIALFAAHALLGGNLLAFGGLRNLQFARTHTPAPELHPVDPPVAAAIRAASRIYIPYTHWEVLYWNFMRFNPAAKYSTGLELRSPADTLILLHVERDGGTDLIPAKLPPGTRSGLVYLGHANFQPVFAQGGGIGRISDRKYILLPVWMGIDASGLIKSFAMGLKRGPQNVACCVGVERQDQVEYRYELQSSATGAHRAHEWTLAGDPDPGIPAGERDRYDTLTIETRSSGRPDDVVRTVRRLNTGPYDMAKDDNPGDRR